jgi:hypothetical protein
MGMARGWGKSEEDLGAEKEAARSAARAAGPSTREERARADRRRGIEMSMARIEEMLAHTENADRRRALEMARAELSAQLEALSTS